MGSKFDLPPDAHVREREEVVKERRTLAEWDKRQSPDSRLALGVDEAGELWVAERVGTVVELSQPGKELVRRVEAPLTDPENPRLSLPRLVGGELLVGRPEGLWLGEACVLAGRFECYDGARGDGGSRVVLASGTPEGRESGTWWLSWLPGESTPQVERLSDPASGVSVWHDPARIGLAWSDEQGIHTISMPVAERTDVLANLVSYYSAQGELYTAPSVACDQTGKAYALFYVFRRAEDGSPVPSREMQLNFERIVFKASATPDGHYPVNLIHRKRIYMIYGMKPDASTARWRVPGTTMWDGAEHVPGGFPTALSDGSSVYIATNKGVWAMGGGTAEEGLDLLSQSWASPEGDVGPQTTFRARLKRWFGF